MKFAARLKFASTGTNAANLAAGAAAPGCRTLAQCISDGDLAVSDAGIAFTIEDGAGNWETSLFTITSSTQITRTSVLRSSAGGTTPAVFAGSALVVFNDVPASHLSKTVTASVDSSGGMTGLVGPDGKVIAIGGGYTPPISQYDRALIIPQIRQANAVKGLSRNINDAQYVGAITDAEVYDTEPGALSVGQSTSKALAFHWGKMLWDLGAGESLLVQARVKTIGATTGSNTLFGNSDATVEGFGLVLYGPTHATQAGRLMFNYKTLGQTGAFLNFTPALVGSSSVGNMVLQSDTYYNITIMVDGATRKIESWVNCQQSLNAGYSVLKSGSTIPAVKRNFGLGHIPADDSFTATNAKAVRFQAFRMAVLPAGLQFLNPGLLDLQFNINPYRFFNDQDYVGVP